MRARTIGLWVACLGCAGCAHASPMSGRAARAPGPGETAVVLAGGLEWPYTLERIAVAVDGAPVYDRSDGGAGLPRRLASVALEPGPHTVAVLAIAAFPCELGSPAERVLRLRAVQSFVVRRGRPAVVRLHLSTGSPLTGFEERVALTASVQGALPDPERTRSAMAAAARVVPDTTCLDPDALVRAECRVAELVRQDRERRDIIALLCHSDKLAALAALRGIVARATGSISRDRQTQSIVRERAAALAIEAEQCIGEDAFSTELVYALVDDRSYGECAALEPPPDPAGSADAVMLTRALPLL